MKWGYLALVAILAACGGGGGGGTPTGVVEVTCGYVNNEGGYNQCTDGGLALLDWLTPESAHALTGETLNVDAGDISRGAVIQATMQVTNSTAVDAQGLFKITFDVGCNPGEEIWPLVSLSGFIVAAGETWTITSGGGCGAMPLGAHTLTGIAYENVDDAIGPEIGRVVVSFNLVE